MHTRRVQNYYWELRIIFGRHPELFELHGITKSDLDETKISAAELTYMIHSFQSAQTFYYLLGTKDSKIEISTFREQFLSSPKVELAWGELHQAAIY